MNNWQMPLVVMIVLAAGLYLLRRMWRSLTGRKAGGCGGCSCAKTPTVGNDGGTLIPSEQITIRRRGD